MEQFLPNNPDQILLAYHLQHSEEKTRKKEKEEKIRENPETTSQNKDRKQEKPLCACFLFVLFAFKLPICNH